MQAVLILISVFPGLLIVLYIYWRDRHNSEPVLYLTLCFLFGMLSTYPAIKMEEFGMRDLGIHTHTNDVFMTFTFTFLVVAFSEEFVKFIFLRYYIFPKEEFDEPMDGIVYSVMISMGFATLENILYIVVRPESTEIAFHIGLIRMVTAVPGHAIFAVLMGYFIGLAKYSETGAGANFYLLVGLLGAVCLHGFYDFLIFMHQKESLIWFTLIGGGLSALFFLKKHERKLPDGYSEEVR